MNEPAQEQAPPEPVTLATYRKKIKTGMPTDGIIVLVGPPKVGKTALAASFPDSYVLELETGGADRIDGRIQDIKADTERTCLQNFRRYLLAAVKDPAIKTIVIDTLDALSDYFEEELAALHGLDSIMERKQGVDGRAIWGDYSTKIRGLVGMLEGCGKLVVVNCHTKDPKIDSEGKVVIAAGINIYGKSGPYVLGRATLVGSMFKKDTAAGNGYFVTFKGGPAGNWGGRVDELNDKTLQLPKENPYSAIAAVFAPPAPEPKPEPAKAAPAATKRQPAMAAGGKK